MSVLHGSMPHESGHLHVTGEATYVDDMPKPKGMLAGHLVTSPVARGRILRIDVAEASRAPGIERVVLAGDIPGTNDIAPFTHDEPLLAEADVFCVGQHVALIVGESLAACRAAAARIVLEIEELPAILDIRTAIAKGEFLLEPHVIRRGDVDGALRGADLIVAGEIETGGQDHFYLETQCALAIPEEASTFRVYSSTQHPSEVQAKVAEVLGIGRNQVVVECARMGGGFGGKETQAAHFAALAALGARLTGRPVEVWLNRDQDMASTGKRHPWLTKYRAGFDHEGRILGLQVDACSDGGWSADLSGAIRDRYLFHLDNAYWIPSVDFSARIARTNLPSNTAFRGFGGPQGVVVIELILDRAADRLRIDPAEIRRRNYYGPAPRNRTPYDQVIVDSRLERIHAELIDSSSYDERRRAIASFNASSRFLKRGVAFAPVKFGISFTASQLNQAGALVLIYTDGTVQVNHGGTEMGQGLFTKMLAIASHELGVSVDRIRIMSTATDKVPNTSATAASSGSDLNGQAVKQACEALRGRLRPIAAELLGRGGDGAAGVRFAGDAVWIGDRSVPFADVVAKAYATQISLSSTGFYRTPDIHYDPKIGRGKPFHYFAYGGAVTEVEVNGLTGEHKILRVDILHDVGDSLVPAIDRGQIEGGFIQGAGWLTTEQILFDAAGRLLTHSPDTYKIPAIGDAPPDFRVELLAGAPQRDVVHGSKAVGEPPLMLATSVVLALRHAIGAFAGAGRSDRPEVELSIPCTPEAVLFAVERMRGPEPVAISSAAPMASQKPIEVEHLSRVEFAAEEDWV
jgi:xanthine dehydrogenase large subunit